MLVPMIVAPAALIAGFTCGIVVARCRTRPAVPETITGIPVRARVGNPAGNVAAGDAVQVKGVGFADLDEAETERTVGEGELRAIVDTIPAMIFALPSAEGPLFLNRFYLEFTGYDAEDHLVPGGTDPVRALQALMHPDDLPEARRTFYHHLDARTPRIDRYRIRRRDGAYRWVEVRCTPLAPGGRKGVMIDIDDQMRSQQALREAEGRLARLTEAASLSQLSAAIENEINQPLAAMIANAEAWRNWLGADPPDVTRARLTASRIIADAASAADVLARIRALFRQPLPLKSDEAIGSLIGETWDLLAEEASAHGITLLTDLDDGLPCLNIDRAQIQWVLVHLIRNAIDATVPNRSVVVVRAMQNDQGSVIVEVSDLGARMSDPELAFELFANSKGHRMGVHLAVCRSIVQQHHGRLEARPNAPRGTTMSLVLPVDRCA